MIPLTVMNVLEGQMSVTRLLFLCRYQLCSQSNPRKLSQNVFLQADLRLPAVCQVKGIRTRGSVIEFYAQFFCLILSHNAIT